MATTDRVEIIRMVIHRGKDPFTAPQMKVVWVPTDIPFVKQPIIKYKQMNSEVTLVVEGPRTERVEEAVKQCAQEAGIRALVVGVVTTYLAGDRAGLAAAVNEFGSALDACADRRMGTDLAITTELRTESHWDPDWR